MSAICGFIQLGDQPLRPSLLDKMLQALEKHGPDGSGSWQDGTAVLGHQMMHVTPESLDEPLPYCDHESGVAITFDGRIDNREDLLASLAGPRGIPVPDSQLILQAYKKWGIDCAERLVGEFAFALWDAREYCLYCVTDPMGVRPLFYTEKPNRYFAFASEATALLNLSDVRAPINNRRLAMLGVSAMTTSLEPELTCFENISRLPAASILALGKTGKKISTYWKPDPGIRLQFKSDAECKEAFREEFTRAVRARLRSAFPVASLLSGGLDSSGIVSVASDLLGRENKRLITLSAVAMPSARSQVSDERKYINLFRPDPNLKMRYVSAPACGPFDKLEELVQSASLCSYSFQHFLYSAFVRVAKRDRARVIMDGHGGEFSATGTPAGYMAELFLNGHWKRLQRELRYFNASHRVSPPVLRQRVLRPLVPYGLLKRLNRHLRYDNLVEYPIRPEFVQDVLGRDIEDIKDAIFQSLADAPNHRQNMARDIRIQQNSRAQKSTGGFVGYQDCGFTYPYLDKRVLEFGLGIDGRFKYRDGQGRQLLRLGMQDLLPKEIMNRTSKGLFSPDYHLRYESQKHRAESRLKAFARDGFSKAIVDYDRVMPALNSVAAYDSSNPVWFDYHPQFLVPNAVYLCYFLKQQASFH